MTPKAIGVTNQGKECVNCCDLSDLGNFKV